MIKALTVGLLLCSSALFAQETLTRANGKKITINDNGTWSYVDSAKQTGSYDCDRYIKTAVNPLSGLIDTAAVKQLTMSNDDGTGFGIIMMNSKDNSTVIVSIETLETSCIDKNALMAVLFTDGSVVRFTSNGKSNCEGRSALYFGGPFGGMENLLQLKEKTANTLMVSTTSGVAQHEFTKEEADIFKNTLSCLHNALTK